MGSQHINKAHNFTHLIEANGRRIMKAAANAAPLLEGAATLSHISVANRPSLCHSLLHLRRLIRIAFLAGRELRTSFWAWDWAQIIIFQFE